jgi:cell division protein FtsA
MARSRIITGLDVGVGSVKVLLARQSGQETGLDFLGFGEALTEGMNKKGIHDVNRLAKSIRAAIDQAEKSCSEKVDRVYVNIGESRFLSIPSHGLVSVSRADGRISQEDINRVIEATQSVNLPSNNEFWGVLIKDFIVDDQKGIERPLEMTGTRLEAEALVLSVFSPHLKKLREAVNLADCQIEDIMITPLACARAVLTDQQKERGSALIDIGHSLTKVVVFQEGKPVHLAIFPLGSSNITDDIAVGAKMEISEAEKSKKEIGSCLEKKITGRSEESRQARLLVKMIKPRVEEILEVSSREVLSVCRRQDLPAGVVLTGGGAKIKGITDCARKVFNLTARRGVPQEINGLEGEDSSWSTVAGLVLSAADEENEMFSSRTGMSWLRRIVRHFIP